MSAETLRKAADEMREYAVRGIAWEPEWDGDRAADKGWLAPPVALAVADGLDCAAKYADWVARQHPDAVEADAMIGHALTIARAYLGGDE